MNCPKCRGQSLSRSLGPKGIAIDVCRSCHGIWLDKGEVYYYSVKPQKTFEALKQAYAKTDASERECPRCRVKMREVRFLQADLALDACPSCGGNWFDDGEISALNRALGTGLDVKSQPSVQKAEEDVSWRGLIGIPLAPLPSLGLRSIGVLAGLYGVLVAFLYLSGRFMELNTDRVMFYAAVFIIVNYLLGPWLTDLSLGWLHGLRWVEPTELPDPLRRFIDEACKKHRMPFPKVGIITDGNPNAFTYGHMPSDARLVLTTGLMDVLDEAELRAVVAHELGHAIHWDMAVMTMAALVPVILYYTYRACMRMSRTRSSSRGRKGGSPFPLIGLTALLLYYVTEYIVLFLSRTREYYADRAAGEMTGEPNRLASALVKVAYGLAGRREPSPAEKAKDRVDMGAARTLGIFDPTAAKSLVATTLGSGRSVSSENLLGAMQWDMWNPWAGLYELNSTHPLAAKRIEALGRQAASYGQQPFVHFHLQKPESYFDEFLVDLFFSWLPFLSALAGAWRAPLQPWWLGAAAGFCVGYIIKTRFSYRTGFYPEMSVSSVLKRVKVSNVRGVPVRLAGKIIGRGVPGFLLSEDIVLQDDTGFIFLDYEQPLALFKWIFAITGAPKLVGQEAVVTGFYRRAPVPYVEVRSIRSAGLDSTCWTLEAKYIAMGLVLAAAVYCGFFVR